MAFRLVVLLESNSSEALPLTLMASSTVIEVADIELPGVNVELPGFPLMVGPVVAVPILIVPEVVNRPISALLRLSAALLIVIATARDGATNMFPVPAFMLAVE